MKKAGGEIPARAAYSKSAGKHFCQVYEAIVQNIYFQFIPNGSQIFRYEMVILQHKDLNRFALSVHDPVFPDTSPLIEVEFRELIMALGGRG